MLINLADALPEGFERYERVVELVDQHPEVLAQSREWFRQYREQGCAPETHKLQQRDRRVYTGWPVIYSTGYPGSGYVLPYNSIVEKLY